MKFLILCWCLISLQSIHPMNQFESDKQSQKRIFTWLCAVNRLKKENKMDVPQHVLLYIFSYIPDMCNKKLLSLLITKTFTRETRSIKFDVQNCKFVSTPVYTTKHYISKKQIRNYCFPYDWLNEIKDSCDTKRAKVIEATLADRKFPDYSKAKMLSHVPWYN